jgi:hypothetical protein
MTSEPKIARITGAAKRLGQAIALAMARAGWDIAVHYSSSQVQAEETAQQIRDLGRRAVTLRADLALEAEVATLVARCTSALGRPDCIVNNASLFDYDQPAEFTYKNLEAHMRVNLAAPLLLARSLHAELVSDKNKSADPRVLINLLDQKLLNQNPDYFSYTLSKVALNEATNLLAKALAPELRVVGLAPGVTLMSKDQSEAGFERSNKLTPLGYSSTPQDISAAVLFLANAHAITGTTLYVDGGQHLKPMERDVVFLTE